jgi:site-specific DNA-methyltransferase (adenine-specific)
MAAKKANPTSKKSTRTSSFGTHGRISHDSSSFYNSSLYSQVQGEQPSTDIEHALPTDTRNRIFGHSSEQMDELPDCSVHLMVTSPPYNAGKEYDQDLTLEDYLALLHRVWKETLRVLVPGGRACINIANLGRKPYIPLHAFIISDMLSLGYLMRGEIIWDKGASSSASTAWGSWRSASNPTLRDVHEYILIFSKDTFGRKKSAEKQSGISRDDFLENTKSIWSFPAASARKIGHPAPFPVELPQRLIELYSFPTDIVLDPFMGSGTTAIAALSGGRDYVGYETIPDYVKLAQDRINVHGAKNSK